MEAHERYLEPELGQQIRCEDRLEKPDVLHARYQIGHPLR
jgi:hypothetical protein